MCAKKRRPFSKSPWSINRRCEWLAQAYSSAVIRIPCARGCGAISNKDWLACSFSEDEGASQLFPPLEQQSAAEWVQELVHQSPVLWGHDRHSWTLQTVRESVPWMGGVSVP